MIRPDYRSQGRATGYPIGLAFLAAWLEKEGHRARILDLAGDSNWQTRLRQALTDHAFGLAGISCMSVQYAGALETARQIRSMDPGLKIALGGAQPSCDPLETLSHPCVDFIVAGEGEIPLVRLLESGPSFEGLETIGGIGYKRNGQSFLNPPPAERVDLNQIPFPAYHLLDLPRYFRQEIPGFAPKKKPAIQIFTSRGCPYHCIYCHDIFGKAFRQRSPDHILAEMRFLYETHGVREFLIYDDNFTMNMPVAKEVCRRILASGMDIALQFPNGIRADRTDRELIDLLSRAGTHSMAIGIESGSPRVQKLIRKGLQLDKVEQCIRWARQAGITTSGFFMIGFPTETRQEIHETIRFARHSDLDHALVSIATPYPGTELAAMVREKGYRTHMDPQNLDIMAPHIRTEQFSFRRIKWYHLKTYLSFYSRPRRLAKMMASWRNPAVFFKYMRGLNKYLFQNLGYTLKISRAADPRGEAAGCSCLPGGESRTLAGNRHE